MSTNNLSLSSGLTGDETVQEGDDIDAVSLSIEEEQRDEEDEQTTETTDTTDSTLSRNVGFDPGTIDTTTDTTTDTDATTETTDTTTTDTTTTTTQSEMEFGTGGAQDFQSDYDEDQTFEENLDDIQVGTEGEDTEVEQEDQPDDFQPENLAFETDESPSGDEAAFGGTFESREQLAEEVDFEEDDGGGGLGLGDFMGLGIVSDAIEDPASLNEATATIGERTFDNPVFSIQDTVRGGIEALPFTADNPEAFAEQVNNAWTGAENWLQETPEEAFDDTFLDRGAIGAGTDAFASTAGLLGQAFVADPLKAFSVALTGVNPRTGEADAELTAMDAFEIVTIGAGTALSTAGEGAVRAADETGALDDVIAGSDDATAATDEVAEPGVPEAAAAGAGTTTMPIGSIIDDAVAGSDEAAQAIDDVVSGTDEAAAGAEDTVQLTFDEFPGDVGTADEFTQGTETAFEETAFGIPDDFGTQLNLIDDAPGTLDEATETAAGTADDLGTLTDEATETVTETTDDLLAGTDDVADVGDDAGTVIDEPLSIGDEAAATADDTVQAGDDVFAGAEDTAEAGIFTQTAQDLVRVGEDLFGGADDVPAGAADDVPAGAADDTLAATDEAGESVDDLFNVGDDAATTVDDAPTSLADDTVRAGEDTVTAGDDTLEEGGGVLSRIINTVPGGRWAVYGIPATLGLSFVGGVALDMIEGGPRGPFVADGLLYQPVKQYSAPQMQMTPVLYSIAAPDGEVMGYGIILGSDQQGNLVVLDENGEARRTDVTLQEIERGVGRAEEFRDRRGSGEGGANEPARGTSTGPGSRESTMFGSG